MSNKMIGKLTSDKKISSVIHIEGRHKRSLNILHTILCSRHQDNQSPVTGKTFFGNKNIKIESEEKPHYED